MTPGMGFGQGRVKKETSQESLRCGPLQYLDLHPGWRWSRGWVEYHWVEDLHWKRLYVEGQQQKMSALKQLQSQGLWVLRSVVAQVSTPPPTYFLPLLSQGKDFLMFVGMEERSEWLRSWGRGSLEPQHPLRILSLAHPEARGRSGSHPQ